MQFLTQKDSDNEDVILSLWHDKLKLLVVTDGEKGCRYFTKVIFQNTLSCIQLNVKTHTPQYIQ